MKEHSSSQYQVFEIPLKKGINAQAVLISKDKFILIHGSLYFICWWNSIKLLIFLYFRAFLVDIGIIIAKYDKTNKNFILFHAIVFIIVDVITIVLYFVSLAKFDPEKSSIGGAHIVLAAMIMSIKINLYKFTFLNYFSWYLYTTF